MQDFLLRERKGVISERLQKNGRVLAAELAIEFGVSEDTVRRDLREMAAAGLCERVYGGALPIGQASTSLGERIAAAPERKAALARTAIQFIRAGMTVFIDASSTNLAIARAIPANLRLTVATNTPLIAAALMDLPEIDIILIGGKVDRHVGAAIGAKAQRDAEVLRPDLCVLGACGVDPQAGLTAVNFEDAEFKRFVARTSRTVLAAVTNDKLGTAAAHAVLPLAECHTLIVEHDAAASLLPDYGAEGTSVVRAGRQ